MFSHMNDWLFLTRLIIIVRVEAADEPERNWRLRTSLLLLEGATTLYDRVRVSAEDERKSGKAAWDLPLNVFEWMQLVVEKKAMDSIFDRDYFFTGG